MGSGVKVKANGISIAVEDTGAGGSQAGRPVVLLIMGLGMQLVAWPPAFVNGWWTRAFVSCVSTTATSGCPSIWITWAYPT